MHDGKCLNRREQPVNHVLIALENVAYQHHIMCYIVLHCYAAPLYFFTECSKKRAEFRYNLDPQTRNGYFTNNEEKEVGTFYPATSL